MSQDTNIPNLVINKLNKQQYEGITPNNTELYFITDEDAYLASDQGSGNAGKVLVVGNDGIVVPQTSPSGTTNYEDLSNKPSINNVELSGNKTASDLGFANVAMTGEYSDLVNAPVLGTAAFTNSTDYATSAQGTKADNAETSIGNMVNLSTPNKSHLVDAINDAYNVAITAVQPSSLANVATTGEYSDLLNTPTIPAAQVNADWNAASGVAEILNKPTLANIATTGEYSDLVNAPSLANVATTGEYSDLLNTPTIPNVPVVVQDFYVNGTTGVIDCTFSATPTTKTVHTIIGNTVINGTWSGNTFTPNTADDILNNANGFVVSVF